MPASHGERQHTSKEDPSGGATGPSSARLRALLRPFLPYSKICREAPVPGLLAQRYRQAFAKNDPVVLSRGEKSVLAANETSQAARARQLPEPPKCHQEYRQRSR